MTSVPPLLPEETLARVYRLARMDGLSVTLIASVFAVMAALARDIPGASVGLLVAGAGAVELHGTGLLRFGDARGMNWLVASQIFLLGSVLAYCAVRLFHLEVPPIPAELQDMVATSAAQLKMTPEAYLRFVHRLTLWIVASVSILYQGGMAIYYLRRRDAVTRALAVNE